MLLLLGQQLIIIIVIKKIGLIKIEMQAATFGTVLPNSKTVALKKGKGTMVTPSGKVVRKRNKIGKILVTDLAGQQIRQFEKSTPFYKKGILKEANEAKEGTEEQILS